MNKAEESAIIEYIKEKPEFLESLSDAIKDICSYMGQILSDEKFMEELKKSGNKQDTAEWIYREEFFDDEEKPRMAWGCNKCGFSLKDSHDKRGFCPNCGAKMKG